jgi:hypothetical protein
VLVDGNGALFREELLREKDGNGAHEASRRIIHAVQETIYGFVGRADMTIVVRVFADLDKLGKIMHESRITPKYGMSNFAEQFNVTRGEFDFIDVGAGKEKAARKMTCKFHGILTTRVSPLTLHRQPSALLQQCSVQQDFLGRVS